jgi:tRNA(Ile)-lysidine synthase
VTAGEADHLFRSLADFDRLVLAVSGGADSMALLHLVADWAKRLPRPLPEILVATVDHGLREGSADEARQVGRAARALGFNHVIKSNDEPPKAIPFSQSWARGLRYRLLCDVACLGLQDGGKAAIVMAHHADDQAETVLMRLARGSGVDGLGAMRSRRDLAKGVFVLRPLLGVTKQRLIASLTERGADWIEDPSNENVRFERVRLRERLQTREMLGLTSDALGLVAHRAARASEALDAATSLVIDGSEAVEVNPRGFVTIDWPALMGQPAEIRLRVLARVLQAVGGRPEPVSLASLEAITEQADWSAPAGKTIAYCAILGSKYGHLHIVREIGRSEPAAVAAEAGASLRWDGRFDLRVGDAAPVDATIRWLGLDGVAALQTLGVTMPSVPRAAAAVLPALWADAEILAVPGLGYRSELLQMEEFSLPSPQRDTSKEPWRG